MDESPSVRVGRKHANELLVYSKHYYGVRSPCTQSVQYWAQQHKPVLNCTLRNIAIPLLFSAQPPDSFIWKTAEALRFALENFLPPP